MTEPLKFEPSEIKINLYTNIPSTKDYKTVPLTFGMLSSPDLKIEALIKPSQYPFFLFQVKYEESVLSKMEYSDVVKTFFIKDEFIDAFNTSSTELLSHNFDTTSDDSEGMKEYYDKRTANIDYNIMLMLKYLLPTRFPVINNHYNSYKNIFLGESNVRTLLYNPFSTRKPIFLKLDGGTYTVKRMTWLNDFLNHPVYKKIVNTGNVSKNGNSSNKELVDFITKLKNENDIEKKKIFQDIKRYYKGERGQETDNVDNVIYTGIQIMGQDPSTYEIYVDIELFDGELKPEEEGNVKCPYYGDYLGNQLEDIIKEANKKKSAEETIPKIIKKNPIFNTTSFTAKKQEVTEGEEEVDEKTKAKREQEDRKYTSYVDEEQRNMYESIMIPFFKDMKVKPDINAIIKKYDINYKNFYTEFLSERRRELEILIKRLVEGEEITSVEGYTRMLELIEERIEGKGIEQRTVDERERSKYLIAFFEIAKELLTTEKYKAVSKNIIDDSRSILGVNLEYAKLTENLPTSKKYYDPISKKYFNYIKDSDEATDADVRKYIGENKINYKNYYVSFFSKLKNSPDESDKSLFKTISNGDKKSIPSITEILKQKIAATTDDLNKMNNYKIALGLLEYLGASNLGGKRTRKQKNKKRRRTRRRR
jgi:hypothetical protein